MTVSIVIPALNEEAGIAKTIRSVPVNELRTMGYGVEIVVVDNGSEDLTGREASKAGAEVLLEPRRGGVLTINGDDSKSVVTV